MSSVINLKSVSKYSKNIHSNVSEDQVPSLSSSMDNVQMLLPQDVNPKKLLPIVKTESCNMNSAASDADDLMGKNDFIVNEPDGFNLNNKKNNKSLIHL